MLTTFGWAATILSIHDSLTFIAFVLLLAAQCFIAFVQRPTNDKNRRDLRKTKGRN